MPRRKHPRGGGGPTTPPEPTPPPVTPETGGALGYAWVAWGAGVSAGGSLDRDNIHTPAPDATLMVVSTFAQLKTALLASGKRFIRVTGSAVLDGAGADFAVTNPHFTVDGTLYTGGGMKDYKMVVKCGDNIWTEMKLAPGEGSTAAKSSDRRALSFNPGNDGEVLSKVLVDHCSLMWGPDVVFSMLNNVEDATVQFSMLGPCLHRSNVPDGDGGDPNKKGYGPNVTVPGNSDPATMYAKRLTFYRNLMPMNRQRNLKYEHSLGVDAVNNVVDDYGTQHPVYGNARAVNIMGNIFKKGPESESSLKAFEKDDTYALYADSYYHSGNVGWEADEDPFTLDWSEITSAALRSTPYDGGPTDADHGSLTVATADATLFADVVSRAGRTYQDAVDSAVKAHVIAGTSDGYYNGAGFPAPHPSW